MTQYHNENKSQASFKSERPGKQRDSKKKSHTAKEIQTWLISQISGHLQMEPGDIDVREPFTSLGLSSRELIIFSGDLEDWLGCRLSPTLLYEYPNIEAISQYLASGQDSPGANAIRNEIQKPGNENEDEVEGIAIIGIGCRFPGANGPGAFWDLLRDGVDAITEVPPDRWDIEFFYDPDVKAPGKMNTRWGGFLEGVAQFDPHFFGISPRESARMDPQQRLLLEVTWEALEDAGQVVECLTGTKTGVFVGISSNDYSRLQASDHRLIDAYACTGNALSIAANRISYLYNFRGPSIAVDTACSSSLVAIHLACRSIFNGESGLALAGGANLILSPEITINFSKVGLMAPDGRCKVFDARADGYVRGEGAGMVVLKPLSKAMADGDPIYAVILGSAVNQDGRTNGLMAPSRQAQEEVLREAYKSAMVSPGEVQYVEAHGTGTSLGDSIEAKALGNVLAIDRAPGRLCTVGSVKTNIGHLEAAAGIASLIKVALSLKHRMIPPSIHFEEPNPHIPFDDLLLRVQKMLSPWPKEPGLSIAGVSSFGFGGTNAHIVLREAPRIPSISENKYEYEKERAYKWAQLLPLSAHSMESLQSFARLCRDFFQAKHSPGDNLWLKEVCYSASLRRSHQDHRLALVGCSGEELVEQLEAFIQGETRPNMSSGRRLPGAGSEVVFVFSGQGAQWSGMGRELLEQEPVFYAALQRCDREIRRYVNWSLLEELTADEASSWEEVDVLQPLLFSIQVALTALWRSWGIEPDAVVGYSLGEVAAAHVSGALSLENAVMIICNRARVLKQASGKGSMAVIELSLEKTRQALAGYEDRVSIAASSSPTITVLSGDPAALEEVLAKLQRQGIFCLSRKENVAVHSTQLEPLGDELLQALEGLEYKPASLPIYSTVTGGVGEGLDFDATYWVRNLREPVLFSAAIKQLVLSGYEIFLEIGPHPNHLSSIQEELHLVRKKGKVLPSMRKKEGERAVMLGSLGALYTLGYPVDWSKLYPTGGGFVRLPSYSWQRERCWLDHDPQRRVQEDESDWLYKIQWEPGVRPQKEQKDRPREPLPPDRRGGWLIFTDSSGVGQKLGALLEGRGDTCVTVSPGKTSKITETGHRYLNPSCPEEFDQLLDAVSGPNRMPCRGVVHLWSLEAALLEKTTLSSIETAQELGCFSVLHLVQALIRAGWREPPRLWLVTRGAQAVGAEPGNLSIIQSPLWGLRNTLFCEHPELRNTIVDLDPAGGCDEVQRLFRELCRENNHPTEDRIALRGYTRYVARLARYRLEDTQTTAIKFRPDGTYLITGGLGGIGLMVARWMVEHGAQHLVLMGRSGPSAAAREAIEAMTDAGARVIVARADVTQEEQVAGLFIKITQFGLPLRGIIHAAGILDVDILLQLDKERFRTVMEPKIKGAWNLHTLTSNESLDFFVLFSSGASVLGAPGQGNYSAANAFLDMLAHYRKAGGKPALSINWGPWAGIGMAAKLDPDGRLAMQGFGSIEPTRRMELLGRLLCQESAQVIAMPINWQQWNKFYSGFGRYALISQLEYAHGGPDSSTSSTEMRHTLLAAEPEKRQQLLEEHFRGQVAEVLGFQVSKLDILQPLNNMGIDSLMAVELKNRIEIELGIVLPLVKFLQGPSIAQLAAQMLEQLVAATSSPSPSPGPVGTPHQDSAEESEQLIAKINELSEKEVDMLLRDMLAAEEDSE